MTQPLHLTSARMIDGSGGAPLDDVSLVVEEGRVGGMSTSGDGAVPAARPRSTSPAGRSCRDSWTPTST